MNNQDLPSDEPLQTWQPRRGPGFRFVAWTVLAVMFLGLILMLYYFVNWWRGDVVEPIPASAPLTTAPITTM